MPGPAAGRYWKFSKVRKIPSARSAAAISSSHSATVTAIGFCMETCLPAARASTPMRACRWWGGDDVDGVDLGVVEQVAVVGAGLRCPPLRCAFAGAVPVCVADGEELGVGGAGVPAGVEPGDVAGPDDADADLVHGKGKSNRRIAEDFSSCTGIVCNPHSAGWPERNFRSSTAQAAPIFGKNRGFSAKIT